MQLESTISRKMTYEPGIVVLLVDDDADDFILLRDRLLEAAPDIAIEWAPSAEAALAALTDRYFDACLIDFYLGGAGTPTGLDVLEKARKVAPDTPYIFFTGHGDHWLDLNAMDRGAFDFIEKGVADGQQIGRAIRYAAKNAQMMKQMRHLVNELEQSVAQHEATTTLLRQSEEQMRVITDALPLPIIYVDRDETYRFINRSYERHRGVSRDIAIGVRFADALPSELYEARKPHIERALKGETVRFEEQALMPNPAGGPEKMCFFQQTYVPHVDQGGNVIGFFAVIYDLTDERQQKEELVKARNLAERANLAKSHFLANMSHELRTPLNAIIGFSDLMHQEIFGPIMEARYRDYAADILRSGQHLLGVVNDLLDISRDELGQLDLRENAVDLAAAIAWAERLVSAQALEKDVRLSADPPDNSIRALVRGDERRIRQMALNLVVNAVKFTPAKGTVVAEVVTRPDESGLQLGFRVRDNGIGIPKDRLPFVLQPFGGLRQSQNRPEDEGCGLGLPLTKRLAELHGGHLTIDSSAGEGTTVTVWFPPERTIEEGGATDL